MTAPVVVILAAGQGTRMRSSVQKLLHPLCGRPIVEWPMAAAREAGAGRVVVVDSPERRLEAVAGEGVEMVVQQSPRGTADAVKAAAGTIASDETVLVINGDVPLVRPQTLRALVEAHDRSHSAATIGTVVLADPSGYGRVVRAPDGTVERVVETKADGDATEHERQIREVNTGIFAFDGDALLMALEQVRADNAQGEYYLPDVVPILREHERTVDVYELPDPGELLQINDRVQLADVTAVAQRQIHEAHMRAGVTIVNPAATVIDHGVQIGQDAVIAPFTSLHSATRIGAGATIGPGSTLIDATVGDGSTLLHCYVTSAEVGAGVSVGPFAYLRPGTVLRDGSKAGTFVEIKNSDVGAGTKIPHLSYIGDAEIGERTNLGAATITANYDGYRKHRTRIGSRVKTSVDTVLVAPVTVGDDAFTAAGSVIGSDVPDGALAGSPGVARSAQRNIEGYAAARARRAESEGEGATGPHAAGAEAAGSPGAAGDQTTGDGGAPEARPEPPPDPELEQIREWVGQGRTDAWIAYRLGVSVERARARKSEAGIGSEGSE
ncbi:MAG TPA: bifunctional UDP-N-acetylglucosamine diphosphorylase/glucosamine-1-phosphate N-acetyltransferase GlmU [Solirubrobacteraceae bacterium]|nr:bifunctional UDP-N-acetylglucosamine diphosphorylase/glucosamine-1-phosphate N-acetyltransferase GlmU [Solirubrobacteraceae bacterium]